MKRLIEVSLLVCLFGSTAIASTLSELRSDARTIVIDAQSVRQRFTDSQYNAWINEGQRIADMKTLCNYKAFSFPLVTGTTYYSMPSDFMMIRRVTRDYLAIMELSPAALDGRSAEWENQSGLPTYYFINFSSRTKIGFAPYPNASSDLATIKVEYMSYSRAMSADADVPFDGIVEFYPFHYSLGFYAAYKASISDERYDKAKVFMDTFATLTDSMKDYCVRRPNYLPSEIGKSK
jgi:hypothetical protein